MMFVSQLQNYKKKLTPQAGASPNFNFSRFTCACILAHARHEVLADNNKSLYKIHASYLSAFACSCVLFFMLQRYGFFDAAKSLSLYFQIQSYEITSRCEWSVDIACIFAHATIQIALVMVQKVLDTGIELQRVVLVNRY